MVAPRVLTIVVTYKSDELVAGLGKTLSAILETSPTFFCATVENSGSAATTEVLQDALRSQDGRHLHLQPPENRGFAPAVNDAHSAAAEHWGPFDVIVLLNPDVLGAESLVGPLVDALASDPALGIAAPVLVDDEGRVDRGTARRRWTPLTLFAEIAGFGESFAKGTRFSRYIPVADTPIDVDITSGALMAIRSTVLGGGLDTRLPLYLEDQEICHRAHRLGYRVTVYPHLKARHIGGASRAQNTESQRNLRCMELANSTAMSMRDWNRVPMPVSRAVVGLAASTRICAASVAMAVPARRTWAREQVQLGRWLLGWALRPARWGQRL